LSIFRGEAPDLARSRMFLAVVISFKSYHP
jgi:hypothetical protein